MTDEEFYAHREHTDPNQASRPDYLDYVNDLIDEQKIMRDYASREN